ncbi:MFS transporter [Clostridium sp. AWRP]|uniref:MFS transporter n=1 Tax=Clostridium sp. AWRP TaxID=2212991 RepID=UPI000FDC165D|nr:MFS transporter [Clostridium sp. AWRP]AZV55476.1 MFS transporter [Clostridium sp. AWRP]
MKNNKNLLFYMLGRFISYIGTGIQQVAIPLYILDITHSGIMMGIFSAVNFIPNVITLPFAGILGDRKNRKNIMVLSDFGRGILVLGLAFLVAEKNLSIYMLFLLQAFISIMDGIFLASSTAILPELVCEDELMKATSLRGGSDAISMIIGPALGGIIYGLAGMKVVFCINGMSFIMSAVCSMIIIYKNVDIQKGKITVKSFFTENGEAIGFIRKSRALMQLTVFFMVANLLVAPFADIVLPFVLKKCIGFGSQQYGYLISFFTLGILLGNIALGTCLNKFSTKTIIKRALVFEAGVFLIFAFSLHPVLVKYFGGHDLKLFVILGIVIFLIGLSNSGINTPMSVNLQKIVPNEMRSRFFAILGIVCQGSIPLGAIIYGFVLDRFPYYYILLTIVLIFSIVTAIFMIKAVPEAYEPETPKNLEKA